MHHQDRNIHAKGFNLPRETGAYPKPATFNGLRLVRVLAIVAVCLTIARCVWGF